MIINLHTLLAWHSSFTTDVDKIQNNYIGLRKTTVHYINFKPTKASIVILGNDLGERLVQPTLGSLAATHLPEHSQPTLSTPYHFVHPPLNP